MDFQHKPIMLEQVLKGLNPKPGDVFVDATLGGGGHAQAMLKELLPGGVLVGIDRDSDALKAAGEKLASYGFSFIPARGNFASIKSIINELQIKEINGILFDIGVSSYQLDNPERGFTYQENTVLDMRMDRREDITAKDLVNKLAAKELTQIFRDFGEEKWAKRIAQFIVSFREIKGEISTTGQLVEIIKNAIPARARREGGHPARRTFQALRMAVNRELESISQGLKDAVSLLAPGGRVGVITFHSLEDRLVKRAFRDMEGECLCPPGLPLCACTGKGDLKVITKKPIVPKSEEVEKNPRARSAKLRIAEKREVLKEKAGE